MELSFLQRVKIGLMVMMKHEGGNLGPATICPEFVSKDGSPVYHQSMWELSSSEGQGNCLGDVRKELFALFPKEKLDFWYCGEIHDYSYELMCEGKPHRTAEMNLPCEKFIVNPFSDTGGKIPVIGDILPCIKLEGWVGYYLVTGKRRYSSAGSDFAGWDDGYNIDLKLHHLDLEI